MSYTRDGRRYRRRSFRRGIPKRLRSRMKKRDKRELGLTRRELGALGSGEYVLVDGVVRRK